MVTETFCTPIDPWRAHAIGILLLHVLHLCCGYSLFAETICVPKKISLGERDETMARITLFPLLFWCIVSFVIIICVEYLGFRQQLPEFDLTNLFHATKVLGSQVDIHFGDSQQEGKHTVGPVLGAPNNLQANR